MFGHREAAVVIPGRRPTRERVKPFAVPVAQSAPQSSAAGAADEGLQVTTYYGNMIELSAEEVAKFPMKCSAGESCVLLTGERGGLITVLQEQE